MFVDILSTKEGRPGAAERRVAAATFRSGMIAFNPRFINETGLVVGQWAVANDSANKALKLTQVLEGEKPIGAFKLTKHPKRNELYLCSRVVTDIVKDANPKLKIPFATTDFTSSGGEVDRKIIFINYGRCFKRKRARPGRTDSRQGSDLGSGNGHGSDHEPGGSDQAVQEHIETVDT